MFTGEVDFDLPDKYNPNQKTGHRSDAFNFLLDEEEKDIDSPSKAFRRDNFNQYINDLSGGDINLEIQNKQIVEK